MAGGFSHSVITDSKGIPYTWGSTANGRCGLKLEDEDNQQKHECISAPTVIYLMKIKFK